MGRRSRHSERPAGRGPIARLLAAAAAILALAGGRAGAQDASGYAELTATRSDSRTEDATGGRTESESDSFLQRYSLDIAWRLYPNLNVVAGGLFERDAVSSEGAGGAGESTARRMRPYLTAVLRSAIASAQFGYYRNEDDLSTTGFSSRNVQEIYNSILGWRPEGLPSLLVRYIRTNSFDAGRLTRDSTDDAFDLVSEYRPIDALQLYYRGAHDRLEDRVQDIEVIRTSHAGEVVYADDWWDRRVHFSAEYDVSYREADVTTGGAGEVVSPVFPIAGLALITDMPADGALAPAPALIDDDRTASVGINLGLPPVAGDDRPRNLGLDLGGDTVVNVLFVWIDRDLPSPVADAFAWDIYTSADNLTWALQDTVFPAPFSSLERRFEVRFADLSARFLKAVTRPLDMRVPPFTGFPEIFVTEIAAARRTPAAEAEGRSSQTTHVLTTGLRTRILDRPFLYHELSYFGRRAGSSPTTGTLSNGFSMRHSFSPAWGVAARLAREDSRETAGSRASYLYSASLRAAPQPALQHSVVFSGRSSEIDGRSSDSSSVYLYTNAELYRGVNANVGLGRSGATGENGEEIDTTLVNALATLVPHETMTVNLLYQRRTSERRGGPATGSPSTGARAGQASVTYRPLDTLYFYFSYRMEQEEGKDDRFLRSHSLSWSPFPDGRLQMLFRYDETFRSEFDATSRVISPRVRWNVTDRWYVELAYESATFDSAFDVRETATWTGTTRITF